MLTRESAAVARALDVRGTTVAIPDTAPTQILRGDGNRFRVVVSVTNDTAIIANDPTGVYAQYGSTFVCLARFTEQCKTVSLCALEMGSAVFQPLFVIGQAADACVAHVVAVCLTSEPPQ